MVPAPAAQSIQDARQSLLTSACWICGHFGNFESSRDLGDYELACSELRLAFNILTFQFSQIRQHKPYFRWVQTKKEIKDMLAGGCTPTGIESRF